MNRNFYCLLTVGAFCLLATGARAQGPGGPGGFQPPPGMQAWRTWRETHKNVGALERTVGALVEVEQDPKLKLTKPQARIVLSVMKKWQSKPTMNDAQASVVNAQLLHSLSPAQKAKVAQASQPRGGFGGRPGGFGGRPGGLAVGLAGLAAALVVPGSANSVDLLAAAGPAALAALLPADGLAVLGADEALVEQDSSEEVLPRSPRRVNTIRSTPALSRWLAAVTVTNSGMTSSRQPCSQAQNKGTENKGHLGVNSFRLH